MAKPTNPACLFHTQRRWAAKKNAGKTVAAPVEPAPVVEEASIVKEAPKLFKRKTKKKNDDDFAS